MFRFEDPNILLILLAIPVMIYFYAKKWKTLPVKYSSLSNIKAAIGSGNAWGQHFLFIIKLLLLTLLIIGLARPQNHSKVTEIISSGVDIMLVLDTSGSMQIQDYSIDNKAQDRLTVVKNVVEEFINNRPGDRMGMVVFGNDAFTQCPLTLDHEILNTFLKDIYIGMVGEATSIGSAVGVAVKRLKDIKAKSKIIILLTDGRSNFGQIAPLTAAELAKTFGIKIYAIGVGSETAVAPSLSQMMTGAYVPDATLDEDTLTKMANITGGLYFKATNTEGLKQIYSTIDKMEKTDIKVKEYGRNEELYLPFLAVAFILFLAEILLANTIFVKLP